MSASSAVLSLLDYETETTGGMATNHQVLVYNGPGAGQRSVASAQASLSLCFRCKVGLVNQHELLAGALKAQQPTCVLLVMPGGADLPYCKELGTEGCSLIREFVDLGGSYLGFCAGAYFAAERIEFEIGRDTEVVGPRELALFPGLAKGSCVPGYDYEGEASAAAVGLDLAPRLAAHYPKKYPASIYPSASVD